MEIEMLAEMNEGGWKVAVKIDGNEYICEAQSTRTEAEMESAWVQLRGWIKDELRPDENWSDDRKREHIKKLYFISQDVMSVIDRINELWSDSYG